MSVFSLSNHRLAYFIVRIFILSVLLSTFFYLACTRNTRNQTENLKEIKVGVTTSYLGEAATFTAQEKGFFKEEGLNIILKYNPSGSISIRDLFDGKVDIAHVAETPVVYSLMDRSYYQDTFPDFQIFADMIYSHKIQKIVANKDRGVTAPKEIAGKKIAIFSGTQLDYFFDSFLLEHNIPRDSVTLVDIEPTEQADAMKKGKTDVAVNWEPYASYIQRDLGDKALILDTKLTYSTLWLATTLDSFEEANPKVLTAYLKAIKKAQDYLKENPGEVQKLMARHTGIELDIIKSLWDEIDFELSLSERMLTLLEDQARWMIRKNIADTSGYDMKGIINFKPMNEVYPNGITVIR